MTTDFEKHTTTFATLDKYEKPNTPSGYYRIWEVAHGRYIDIDKYDSWLNWEGTPDVVDLNPVPLTDEQKLVQIRAQRTALLRDCDWTDLQHCPHLEIKKSEWVVYRDALRDIPQDYKDPDDVVWPTPPA